MTGKYERVVREAQEAARSAWDSAVPIPMIVYTTKGLSDVPDLTKPVYRVDEGVCGFAWLEMDGRTGLAKYLKKLGIGRKQTTGGYVISSWELVPADRQSQSFQRKDSAVRAAAEVFQRHGLKARPVSRLD